MLNLPDLRLADVMTASPLSFTLDTPVEEACRALINESVLAAPVFDDDSQETLEVSVAELLEFTIDFEQDGFEPTLRDLDLKPALCLPAEFPLPRACQEMIRRGARRILIGRAGHPEGIMSATDIVRAVACLESCNQTPAAGIRVPEPTLRVRDLMRQDVITISPEESVHDVLQLLGAVELGQLCVSDGESLLGIVTRKDVIEFWTRGEDPRSAKVWSLMTPGHLATMSPEQPLSQAANLLEQHGALPVVSGRVLVGLLTRIDALRHYARRARSTGLTPRLEAEVAALLC